MPILLALLQSVAGPPAPVVPHARIDAPCPPAAEGDDVVVCGRVDRDAYRLRAPAGPPDHTGLPRAEARFGGGTIGLSGEAGAVGNVPTNRVMLKWVRPF